MSEQLESLMYEFIKAKKRRSEPEILRNFSIKLTHIELSEIINKLKYNKKLRQRTISVDNYGRVKMYYAIRPKFTQLELFND
jgi:hypothetical protein